jgi:hypothetical protein
VINLDPPEEMSFGASDDGPRLDLSAASCMQLRFGYRYQHAMGVVGGGCQLLGQTVRLVTVEDPQ